MKFTATQIAEILEGDIVGNPDVEVSKLAKIEEGTTQMLITSLDYSSFTGRIAIGRLTRGELKVGQNISLVKRDGKIVKNKINRNINL